VLYNIRTGLDRCGGARVYYSAGRGHESLYPTCVLWADTRYSLSLLFLQFRASGKVSLSESYQSFCWSSVLPAAPQWGERVCSFYAAPQCVSAVSFKRMASYAYLFKYIIIGSFTTVS
jgi:hypothetical protein